MHENTGEKIKKPRKVSVKVLTLLIICGGIIGATALLSRSSSGSPLSNVLVGSAGVITQAREETDNVDTDSDGLLDWQEVLIGTDLSKSDTDGDGAPDGAETQAGRDPRIKGPNDKNANIPTIVGGTNSVNSTSVEEGTLTDQMSKDFFARYLLLKQGGKEVTPEQAAKIAENTLKSADYTKTSGVVYTRKNIRVGSKTSKDLVEMYSKSITQILINRAIEDRGTTLDIISSAVKNQDQSELKKLDPIIASYKGVISDLVNLEIPSDAVDVHLNFLNSYSNLLSTVEAMRVLFTDPVRSFSAIGLYQGQSQELVSSVEKLSLYFKSK